MAYPEFTAYCDGAFLIFDTAEHIAADVDPGEVREHVAGCRTCGEAGTDAAEAADAAREYNGESTEELCACRAADASVNDRVLAGAGVLKRVYGADFRTRIDVPTLNIWSLTACVLGQLGRDEKWNFSYNWALDGIKEAAVPGVFGHSTDSDQVYGCCLGLDGRGEGDNADDPEVYADDCAQLTAEWKKLLTEWDAWSELI